MIVLILIWVILGFGLMFSSFIFKELVRILFPFVANNEKKPQNSPAQNKSEESKYEYLARLMRDNDVTTFKKLSHQRIHK
jgi:hypothetical protein